MTMPSFQPDEHSRIEHVMDVVAGPSFALLNESDRGDVAAVPGAEDTFRRILTTMLELQRAAILPTDAAFEDLGGPNPRTVGRFWRRNDLSRLPMLQLRKAVDAGMIAPPTRLILDAHTQPSSGPEKFGVCHLRRPNLDTIAGFAGAEPTGAPNTQGGIATAILYADCDGVIVPAGAIPIAQGHWDPTTWATAPQLAVEERLRDRGRFVGIFVTAARDVAREIINEVKAVDDVALCATPWENVVITGGRLRLGFPDRRGGFGAGTVERYVGCVLDSVRDLSRARFDVFLELPQTRYATRRASLLDDDRCDWTFATVDGRVGLEGLEDRLLRGAEPWKLAPSDLVRTLAGPRHRILTLSTTAFSRDVPDGTEVTLVMAIDPSAGRELYVTNLMPKLDAALGRIVGLVVAEAERRRRDSTVEQAITALLRDCYLQTNPRVRHPDRQSFAGMAQAAYSVGLLAQVGAAA
jgi:hypothetical protein